MRIRFWRKPPVPDAQRQALARWVWLRFLFLEDDPMVAIIGAVARLTDEGMEQADAIELVVGILREGDAAARTVGNSLLLASGDPPRRRGRR